MAPKGVNIRQYPTISCPLVRQINSSRSLAAIIMVEEWCAAHQLRQ
jgi:hypothetical protein